MVVAKNNVITLKGSTEIVTEFFGYSINSILYQRGIYPPEDFGREDKWGLTMLVTNDPKLKEYLNHILIQLSSWLLKGSVQKLVVAVSSTIDQSVLERWVFDIETEIPQPGQAPSDKSSKEISAEIQAVIKQIVSCVTFLPILNEPCSFDLLIYTDKDLATPKDWEQSDPKYIANAEQVKLRGFTTTIHKVDSMVSYKAPV